MSEFSTGYDELRTRGLLVSDSRGSGRECRRDGVVPPAPAEKWAALAMVAQKTSGQPQKF